MPGEEKRILESTYSQAPVGLPSFVIEVLVPVGAYVALTYAMVYVTRRELALFAGALAGILSLTWLLFQWHAAGRPVSIKERTTYVDEPPPPALPAWQPVTQRQGPGHTQWVIGALDFSPAEWQRLARALGDGRVSRRALDRLRADDGGRLFANITETYPEIVAELQRLGWVDEENRVTDVCRAWFHERHIALESPLPGAAPSVRSQRYGPTTTDRPGGVGE